MLACTVTETMLQLEVPQRPEQSSRSESACPLSTTTEQRRPHTPPTRQLAKQPPLASGTAAYGWPLGAGPVPGCHRGARPAPPLTWQPADVGPGHSAEEDAVQVGDLQPEGRDRGVGGERGAVQPPGGPPGCLHLLVLLHGPLRALAAVEEIPAGKGHQGRPGQGAPSPAQAGRPRGLTLTG